MTAERAVAAALLGSAAGSAGLLVLYLFMGGQPQLEGILLALSLGGIGVAIAVWAIALLEGPVEVEERYELESTEEVRTGATQALDIESITRRRFLVRLLAGAGAFLLGALALPALSLGPRPGRSLFHTSWRAGALLVGSDGDPFQPGQLAFGSVRTVFPEGHVGDPDAQTLLIRIAPEQFRMASEAMDRTVEGCVAYSKICTHAGCPVGLFRAEDNLLLCPCHQSTFDVARGAVPTFGPAARPLPQLPMAVDADGYLVAVDDYPEPVGPSFWNMTHPQEDEA